MGEGVVGVAARMATPIRINHATLEYAYSRTMREGIAGHMLEREIPFSDLGDWSMYSYRGEVSDQNYHELLREVMQSMCTRHLGEIYCTYAARYRRYQTEPPKVEITGPASTAVGSLTRIRFTLSKLSAVELRISREGRVGVDKVATFSRGNGSFSWRPSSPGTYAIHLGAKEKRTGKGLKGHDDATIQVN